MFDKLFTPITIRGMELKNRVVLPAMGTRMATEKSEVSQRLVYYHAARAKGGCALNIVEVSSVHTPSAPANFVSISGDWLIEGHKRLTAAIHEAGGKAGVQLWQGSIAATMDPNAQVLVASDMPFGPYTIPGLAKDQIDEIVACYGYAAKRCVEAGYDCIEFHCAHNYLPHSFLCGGLNHRTDEYGGNLENRARFPLECIRAIRENIPADMPLFMRIDAHDDYLPGGLTIEDTVAFCKLAGKAGVDVLDVSRGNIITPASVYEVPPIDIPNGFNVDNAAYIRKETGMLTIAVGRITTAELAEEILEQCKADLIVMGRAQLADPEFCNKARAGKTADITRCVGCNQGCYDGFCDVVNRPFITCLRNPMIGHEGEYTLDKTDSPKRVFIAGGGVAGMETAKILHERGHKPEIFEKSNHLGGQFILAGMAPGKGEMKQATEGFADQIIRSGIPIHFGTELTSAVICAQKPDAVIIAAGSSPISLPLDGMSKKPLYTAAEILEGKTVSQGCTAVIGGGLVGLEVADALASTGHIVKVIEMKSEAGADLGSLRKITVMQKMQQLGVEIITDAVCSAVSEEGIMAKQGEQSIIIPCDCIVIAVGSRANDCSLLVNACNENKIPYSIIGDAKQARRALNAIAEGFEAARLL